MKDNQLCFPAFLLILFLICSVHALSHRENTHPRRGAGRG